MNADERTESNALARLPGQGSLIPEEWGLDLPKTGVVTSLALDTEAGRIQAFNILTQDGKDIKESLNMVIEVSDYLITPAGTTDKATGEVSRFPLTRLIAPDGSWVQTGSRGIAKSLALACQLLSLPPWKPPIKFRPKAISLSDGQQFYQLELVELPKKPVERRR